MTSLLDVPLGTVSPRVLLVPDAADSEGHLACDLAAGYGLDPFRWQREALVGWMGVRQDGQWAASRGGMSVPRQNGKNGAAEIFELWVTSQLGMRVLHSAHEVKTARKAFKRLLDFYDNPRSYPELHDLVKEIRRTNGQEAVELHNGGGVEFVARTKSSGRGFSADIMLLDEAQELTDEQLEAMLPAISASRNPQTFLMGTPPKPEQPAPVWRRFRAAGVKGEDPRLFWLEYAADPDDDPADRAAQAKANPGAPESISWGAVDDEREAMSHDGFARERLGIWTDVDANGSAIPAAAWKAVCDSSSQIVSRPCLAVDVSPTHGDASIGVAGYRVDGHLHVELLATGRGTAWVPGEVARLQHDHSTGPVGFVKGSAAESLLAAFTELEVLSVEITVGEYAAACGDLLGRVSSSERSLRHVGQPQLDGAVGGAGQRVTGDRWIWDRRVKGVDITPLCAVTSAAHMAVNDESFNIADAIW